MFRLSHAHHLSLCAVALLSVAGCSDDDDAPPSTTPPMKPPCTASTAFPFESRFVEVLGSRMHYVDEGEGEVVLMLHGNPTSSYLWRNIIGPVAENHRVIALDLIGMGKSDQPDVDYTFDTHSGYLSEFIETLGLSNITFVVHDWGSGLGFDYASRHPGRVRAIAFMEAVVEPGVPASFATVDPATAEAFMAWRDPVTGPQLLQEENQFLTAFLPDSTSCTLAADAVQAYLEPFPTPASRKPVAVWPTQIPIDGEPRDMLARVEAYNAWLRTSTLPKLGLSANPGFILPPAAYEFLATNWTNLTVVDIGEGLHFVQERQPEAITAALIDWLATIGGSDNAIRRTHVANLDYTDVEGHQLAYLERGAVTDPAVIMLHGVPTSSLVFRDIVDDVAAAGYRVIAPDMLGFGQSDKPIADIYSLDDHARRVFALADDLGIDTFTLLVHDVGGFVGWRMLEFAPDRLDRLIITGTALSLEGVTPNELAQMHLAPMATLTPRDVWSQLDDPAWAEIAVRSFFTQGLQNDALATDALIEAYTEPVSGGTSEAIVQLFEDIVPKLGPDAVAARRDRFRAFEKPVAVIHGAEDGFFDATIIPALFAADFSVQPERVTIVQGAGHYLQEEDPAAYQTAVINFLTGSN